jgi:hypothetical protein
VVYHCPRHKREWLFIFYWNTSMTSTKKGEWADMYTCVMGTSVGSVPTVWYCFLFRVKLPWSPRATSESFLLILSVSRGLPLSTTQERVIFCPLIPSTSVGSVPTVWYCFLFRVILCKYYISWEIIVAFWFPVPNLNLISTFYCYHLERPISFRLCLKTILKAVGSVILNKFLYK